MNPFPDLVLQHLSHNPDTPANDHGPLRLGWTCILRDKRKKGSKAHPHCYYGYGPTLEAAFWAALQDRPQAPKPKAFPTLSDLGL